MSNNADNIARDIESVQHRLIHKVVVFGGEELRLGEYDFFDGQKGRVIDVKDVSVDDTIDGVVWEVVVDFAEFELHNMALAKPVYYDPHGVPCLKWHETATYPTNKRQSIFIGANISNWPFTEILEDGRAGGPVVLSAEDWEKVTSLVGVQKIKELGIKPL